MSGETLIKVENVSKKFCRDLKKSLWYGMQDLGSEILRRPYGSRGELRPDEFWAVKDVSFELKRGECLGLIGRNGAGKTTLLRMLNGLIKPDRGRVELRGRVGALISLGAGFNPILTGRENIYVNASVLGISRREMEERIDEVIDFSEIKQFIDAPVQSYSSGMQVRLGFAIASVLEPDILLLDEILAVGDSRFRVKCFNRIQRLLSDCAVIFISHNMAQITRISSQLMLLHEGSQIVMSTDLGSVISRYNRIDEIDIQPSIEGCGKFPITSVLILDAAGNASPVLHHGDAFSIQLGIDTTRDKIPSELKLLITVSDEEDACVAQIYETLPRDMLGAHLTLHLDFSTAPFNAGRYWLTTSTLIDESGELGYVYRRSASFVVENAYVGYAPIILNPRVQISSSNPYPK
jgi:lipopolysaccharide transport system ATP-binding protein